MCLTNVIERWLFRLLHMINSIICIKRDYTHSRSQDFPWVHFPPQKKKLMTFLVIAVNTHAKTAKLPSDPPRPKKNSSKNWLLPPTGDAHTTSLYKLRQKILSLWGAPGAFTVPPGYTPLFRYTIELKLFICDKMWVTDTNSWLNCLLCC